jgi:hypothetical protein
VDSPHFVPFCCAVLLVACGGQDEPAPTAALAPEPAARRVVSLSPAATAFVVDLGAGCAKKTLRPSSACARSAAR